MDMTLVDFLKKYSTISNKFIDDFFSLYDINKPDDFTVDLDKLCRWLKCYKHSIKATLSSSYTNRVDYIILRDKIEHKTAGKPRDRIMLTSDTVKLLCMRSRAKKAEQVRNYYLSLEKFIDKYKNHVISSMNDKIKSLESNQKPKVNHTKGIIYVIKTSDDISLYKIGRTKNLRK